MPRLNVDESLLERFLKRVKIFFVGKSFHPYLVRQFPLILQGGTLPIMTHLKFSFFHPSGLDSLPYRILSHFGKLIPTIIPEIGKISITYFPKAMLLIKLSSQLGFHPNMRARPLLIVSNKLCMYSIYGIFRTPQSCPWFHIVIAPLPPNFRALNFTHNFCIPEIQTPSVFGATNFVPSIYGKFGILFPPSP